MDGAALPMPWLPLMTLLSCGDGGGAGSGEVDGVCKSSLAELERKGIVRDSAYLRREWSCRAARPSAQTPATSTSGAGKDGLGRVGRAINWWILDTTPPLPPVPWDKQGYRHTRLSLESYAPYITEPQK